MLSLYTRVFLVQVKNNFVREAVYRTNFLTSILVDFIWIGVEFSLFAIIYANVETLAGWTKPQVYFFLGMFFSADAIFSVLFQTNFWHFSDLVNKGELDILLTKPVHPLFLALTRWMNLTSIFNVLLGLAICVRYADQAGFEGGWKWLYFLLWIPFGALVELLIRFLFSIWIFWTDRSFAISRLYYQFFAFATKPDALYPQWIRYLILTIIPFGFVSSVPSRALLHGISAQEFLSMFIVLILLWGLNAFLWKTGLKRYQSASS